MQLLNNKNKFKKVSVKIFIIPFFIITLIFFIIGYGIISGIKSYYYNHVKEDSINFANSYSHSLSKSAEAYEVLNELLKEKILVAGRTIVSDNMKISNELLEELAGKLEVDRIYSYNSKGEIIHSNNGESIGWKAYEGHPVYNFMKNGGNSLIEEIRQDTETGIYYKYGYFRVSDGRFVQIGVKTDKIYDFLGSYKMQKLLNEMKDSEVVSKIDFIDNKLNIIGSTDSNIIGQKITNSEAKAAILEDRKYSFINDNNEKNEFETFVPVYFERAKIGTLAINKSLEDTDHVVRQVSQVGVILLAIIYASLLHTMISIYKKNKKLVQSAYYDALTDLPNKQYLKEFLNEEINKNKSGNKAILLINCSNFRIFNLTFGIEYGDELLKEMSKNIQNLVDSNNKFFRFSAGRFVLYIENYYDKEDLISIANKVSEIFDNPFKVKDDQQHLSVQIGIVEINNNDNFDKILKHALISLNHIKDNDSVKYAFFNEVMENKLQREDLIEKELRSIIVENNEKKLYLEFQPQVDLKTNKIVGFEALARMKAESLGFISPMEFIDVAEKKQLIIPLGNLILKTACNFINTIQNQGYNDVKVAVNISGIQLLYKDFTNTVVDIIKETNIEKSNLELEITESVLLDNYDIINEKLRDLRENKIEVALDDFGTGYSSFSRLGELNIDTVKIDKYFIDKILSKDYKEQITGDIISMSHKLGLNVVAEGVEVKEQKDFLINNHCDIMQGYLFSKPLLEEDAIKLLKTTNKESL